MNDTYLPSNVIPPREVRDRVFREYLETKLNPEEISVKLNLPLATVKTYLSRIDLEARADEIKQMVKIAVLENKVPILQAIADVGLLSVYEWLTQFFEEGRHKDMKIVQAKNLVELIEKLHNMYRLEVGKSTANIDMMIQKTQRNINVILDDLRKPAADGGDPFGNVMDAEPTNGKS